MKVIFASFLIILSINVFAQVTLPNFFVEKTVKKIPTDSVNNKLSNKFGLSKADGYRNTFIWLPSIKFIKEFQQDSIRFLQKNQMAFNDSLNNIALYSEIAADYIGPVRVSAGVTLAYPKTDTNSVVQEKLNRDKFVQRFGTSGGAVVFNFAFPISSYYSDYFNFQWALSPRYSIDPPSFGVSNGKFSTNVNVGSDVLVDITGVRKVFNFFGTARFSYINGNSTFFDGLDLHDKDRKGFFLNSYQVGVNIKDLFSLSYTKFWGNKTLSERLGSYLSFTVEPNFK